RAARDRREGWPGRRVLGRYRPGQHLAHLLRPWQLGQAVDDRPRQAQRPGPGGVVGRDHQGVLEGPAGRALERDRPRRAELGPGRRAEHGEDWRRRFCGWPDRWRYRRLLAEDRQFTPVARQISPGRQSVVRTRQSRRKPALAVADMRMAPARRGSASMGGYGPGGYGPYLVITAAWPDFGYAMAMAAIPWPRSLPGDACFRPWAPIL